LRGTKVRLFVEERLTEDGDVSLTGKPAHYLTHVMRLGAGDSLRLFNGRDGEWRARLEQVSRGGCSLRLETPLRPQQPEPGPWLVFAPLKKDAQDTLIAQATQLGAERLLPVITRFTSAERVNRERLRSQAIEAAEQCGRLSIPAIDKDLTLAALLASWPPDRALLFADERGSGIPIAAALRTLGRPPPGFLVGPEGGFAEEERDAIVDHPAATAADLGPRILRAETAAAAALACWQALCGDWRPIQSSGSENVRTEC
jgi:16S rRNA (uracil1498-N3)-methyltransferase